VRYERYIGKLLNNNHTKSGITLAAAINSVIIDMNTVTRYSEVI